MDNLDAWWKSFIFVGNPSFVLHKKLEALGIKIRSWVKANLSKVKEKLELLTRNLELEEEDRVVMNQELSVNTKLTSIFIML